MAPISQTLTLIAYYKGTSDVVNSSLYQLTLSAINQISSDTSTNVYGYVRGTSVTITTNSLNLGHRVLGYGTQANQSSGFSGTATTGYQNSATFTFTIEQNLTMYIYFELRDFTVAFESNANTITGGNAPFASQGITARETTSSQSINLPFDANSTSTSTIHLSYGQSLAFLATNTPVNSTQLNSKNLRLVSVTIKDASNDTQIKQLYSSNQNSAVMTDEEIISMVEDGNSITDSIRIVFRYNFTQIVRIKFASSVTNTDPLAGATIQFNNEDIQGYNLGVQLTPEVINTIKTNLNGYEVTLTADEDGTNYNIIFLMKIDYVVTDSTTNVTSTQFVLSLDGGSPITFEISQITYNNNAVNITGYFVFSN